MHINERSLNVLCRGKAISISSSECVSVAFVIQHPLRMCRIILSLVACLVVSYFSTLYKKMGRFKKRFLDIKFVYESYVYWTVHHLDSWIKGDQLDVTCFIISLFNAQQVSDVNTSIFRSLRLICWVILWVVLLWFDVCWCYVVVWLGWCGIRIPHQHTSNQSNTTHEITQQIRCKLLRMDVLTFETCWALNSEIINQVTSSWSLFIQLFVY